MALGIASFRRSRKEETKPQESPPKEPPAQSSTEAVGAKQIGATVERLKVIRSRLRNNKSVETWRLAYQSLPNVLAGINSRAKDVEKNRANLLLKGEDPDSLLRQLAQERCQAEQNLKDLKAAALRQLDSIYGEYVAAVNEVSPGIWKEWQRLRKELLAMLERWGDFGEQLGAPVVSLAKETDQFNTDFSGVRQIIPGAGAIQAPVRVPRLGRGWDWGTYKKVVLKIRQWLI